jgi:hypothetical protein
MTDPSRPSSQFDNDGLVRYFAARRSHREGVVVAKYAALTEREKALVREAAVLGYVQGFRASPYTEAIPGDRLIVAGVLDAVDSFADLYPTLAALPSTLPPDPDQDDSDQEGQS